MKLVDSTLVIDVTRGVPAALEWVDEQAGLLAASEVTRTEVLQGMRSAERARVTAALESLEWFPVDEAVSARAGELGRAYRASHHLGVGDLLVAATAQEQEIELVTSNVKHFPMFPGLTAPY